MTLAQVVFALLTLVIAVLGCLVAGASSDAKLLRKERDDERYRNELLRNQITRYKDQAQKKEGKMAKTHENWSTGWFIGVVEKPKQLFVITRRDTRQCWREEFETYQEAEELVVKVLAPAEPTVQFVILGPKAVIQAQIPIQVQLVDQPQTN